MDHDKLHAIARHFKIEGELLEVTTIKTGHINSTYCLTYKNGDDKKRSFIIQAINRYVFKHPEQIMENITAITAHMRKKIIEAGGDPERETLNFLRSCEDKEFYIDEADNFWRAYVFIDNSRTYNEVNDTGLLYSAGYAFGNFQRMLSDFPIDALHETIPDFHNTKKRMDAFAEAVKRDEKNRAKDVQPEIEFFQKRFEMASRLIDMLNDGRLPLRVTHNDTKYNNILIDNDTGKALCVIDLDTVMPGLSVYDFGDAIRFAASSAAEDETDLSKVFMNLEHYEAFTKGFMEATKGFFTQAELDNMAWGARIITMELASRFLMDHLNGDLYFRIHRENHNLDRARNQIKIVTDMESKFDEMCEIVKKYS
jgi:thiamine kinase-like enzyme